MKRQTLRPLEDRIETTTIRLPPAKDAIDAGVVNLPATFLVPFDRQFLPLASQVKEFQYVIEEERHGRSNFGAPVRGFRRSGAARQIPRTARGSVPLDLLPASACVFAISAPQKNGTVDRLRWLEAKYRKFQGLADK